MQQCRYGLVMVLTQRQWAALLGRISRSFSEEMCELDSEGWVVKGVSKRQKYVQKPWQEWRWDIWEMIQTNVWLKHRTSVRTRGDEVGGTQDPHPLLRSLDLILCTAGSCQIDETSDNNIQSNDCYYYTLLKVPYHWIINIIFILVSIKI